MIVGGGSGGCSLAAKFSRKIDPSSIAVIDPAEVRNKNQTKLIKF